MNENVLIPVVMFEIWSGHNGTAIMQANCNAKNNKYVTLRIRHVNLIYG